MTRRDDTGAGAIAAIVVLTGILLLAAAGTMTDGGRVLESRRHASIMAFESARAGAQSVAIDSLHGTTPALDPTAADAAARTAFTTLAAGTSAVLVAVRVNGDQVEVQVRDHVRAWFPFITPAAVTVTGRARILANPTGAP